MVGRISYPEIAEDLINSDADAILLSRQMIADEQWLTKVKQGRERIFDGVSPQIIVGGR